MPHCRLLAKRIPLTKTGIFLTAALVVFLLFVGLFASTAYGDEPSRSSARVIYHFVKSDQLDAAVGYADREPALSSVCAGEIWQEGDRVLIRANTAPNLVPTSGDEGRYRVLKDYASTRATGKGTQDLTAEATYNAETGIVSLPARYADCDLTVAWYVDDALQANELSLQVRIKKTVEGISSETMIEHAFHANAQAIDLKLFDDEEMAGHVESIHITQGGSELTQFVYQNGSISIGASPLGGPIDIELDDGTQTAATEEDHECTFNAEPPLFSLFSAANPVVGERFALDADCALIRTCEPGGNMAQVMGWPEKSGTYGFAVHFNHCVNPEVVNADQNHVAPGGTVHTPGGGTYDYNWVKGLHFAWGECAGNVDDNGTGEPKVKNGWVEVTNVDYATQTVSYRFYLNVCSDIDGHAMQSITGTFQVHEDLVGYLELKKQSALPDVSADNPCYSLEGARYGIYSDTECTDLKQILTTDAYGCARSKMLPVGTYHVKEISAPTGFALDINAHDIDVRAGTTRTLTLDEVPQSDPTPTLLAKHDSDHAYDGEHNSVQGGASSLKDAEFTIRFFPTLDTDYAQVKPLRKWVVKTDEHGFIDLRKGDGCKVSGDDFFMDSNGAITLPIGTYEIRETKAPDGYKLNEAVVTRTVTGLANGSESVSSYNTPIISDSIMRGGIDIEKRDAESGLQSALGAATLDNTAFTVTNDNSHEVYVNGIPYQPGEICARLETKDGKANLTATTLPYGDYTLREVSAGDGYNPSDNKPRPFSIEYDGQIVHFSDSADGADEPAFRNLVKRGDLNFIKVHENSSQRLAGVPFKITSKTTGEAHIVVSDANGIVDTSADWVKHTHETNGNDEREDGSGYAADRGVWFGKTQADSTTEPRDDLGALPFDTYTLEELPCAANAGFELVATDFTIYRDEQRLDFGVIENHDPSIPWISTIASDASDHDKLLFSSPAATINDHVQYGNLKQGETYTLRAALVDAESDEQLPGASGETIFTAAESTGTTEVSIPVNLLEHSSEDIVVYETLLQGDETILEHHEKDNSEQTVSVVKPRIATSAVDAADGDHEVLNDAEAHIVDTVHFDGLTSGKEYTVTGTLMVKSTDETGTVHVEELRDDADNPVTSTNTFTPQTNAGSVDVTFTFSASALEAGTELVVFERLISEEQEIATHEDPEDENQTLRITKPEEPPATPNVDEPTPSSDFSTPPTNGSFAKTGSAVLPLLIAFGIVLACGLVFIGIALHKHRKGQAVTDAIARNMLGTRDIWHP